MRMKVEEGREVPEVHEKDENEDTRENEQCSSEYFPYRIVRRCGRHGADAIKAECNGQQRRAKNGTYQT
jgi:hypothetical protein